MSHPLLLDEMFPGVIAEQLRGKGHDVLAVVDDPALAGSADEQILAQAAAAGRALVAANIKDFMPPDARYRAASQTQGGLILVSAKTFPQRPHLHRSRDLAAGHAKRPRSIRPRRSYCANSPRRPELRCYSARYDGHVPVSALAGLPSAPTSLWRAASPSMIRTRGNSAKQRGSPVKLLISAGEPGVRARWRPSAEHAAMAAAAVWLAGVGVLHAMMGITVPSLFSVAPLIVATVADERRTAVFAGAAVALTIAAGWWHGTTTDTIYWTRVAVVCVISTMAVVVAGIRRRREERLARMTAIAQATQLALLPPLPAQMTGITIAARYRSATREASVGGDLYEVIPTGHGIRLIIGDVRGNGLDAIRLAGQVLSAFRRTAVATPTMEQLAGEVGQAIGPHLGEEDFVTAALAQIAPTGGLTIVNCGHPPPLLRHRGNLQPLAEGKPGLPLGLDDVYTAFTASWSPGDRLLLYTDGLVESRDAHGDFLPHHQIARALAAPDCGQALDTLMTAAHRHTRGHAHDDIALLLLEHGGSARSSADRNPPAAPAQQRRGQPSHAAVPRQPGPHQS